jgi:hypothetical protein
MHLAVTRRLNSRLPSAGPKSHGLSRKLGLLFARLCRSDASRAPSSRVCAAQPHTHQRILLQPGIRHRCSFEYSVGLRAVSQATATGGAFGLRGCFRSLGELCPEASLVALVAGLLRGFALLIVHGVVVHFEALSTSRFPSNTVLDIAQPRKSGFARLNDGQTASETTHRESCLAAKLPAGIIVSLIFTSM